MIELEALAITTVRGFLRFTDEVVAQGLAGECRNDGYIELGGLTITTIKILISLLTRCVHKSWQKCAESMKMRGLGFSRPRWKDRLIADKSVWNIRQPVGEHEDSELVEGPQYSDR